MSKDIRKEVQNTRDLSARISWRLGNLKERKINGLYCVRTYFVAVYRQKGALVWRGAKMGKDMETEARGQVTQRRRQLSNAQELNRRSHLN